MHASSRRADRSRPTIALLGRPALALCCCVEKPPSSAEAAWRRADERGHPGGASKLGLLLKERGDLEGATAAWRRAADPPDQQGTTLARDALSPTDD
jgi:hypothetical protein